MTAPLNPADLPTGPSEFSWGAGIFPPGIRGGEGETQTQDDFGAETQPTDEDSRAGYAWLVAQKRTDTTDPASDLDFETTGNPDRYGPGLPYIREPAQPNEKTVAPIEFGFPPLERKP